MHLRRLPQMRLAQSRNYENSINYANIFRSMPNLKKNEEYAITLLERLKYLRDKGKPIGEKED